MKKKKYLYNKTQYSFLIISIIVGVLLFVIFSKKENAIFPSLLLCAILFLFHKLTITIDSHEIAAKFAFGVFKQTIDIKHINFDKIDVVKTNWLTGIGIRFTNKGMLYNIKPGSAIIIYTNDETKDAFLIGTDDFQEIKKVLISLDCLK